MRAMNECKHCHGMGITLKGQLTKCPHCSHCRVVAGSHIDATEVLAWAAGIIRMEGTEYTPTERTLRIAYAAIQADLDYNDENAED